MSCQTCSHSFDLKPQLASLTFSLINPNDFLLLLTEYIPSSWHLIIMFEEWLSVPQTKLQREIVPQPLSGRHSVTLGKDSEMH